MRRRGTKLSAVTWKPWLAFETDISVGCNYIRNVRRKRPRRRLGLCTCALFSGLYVCDVYNDLVSKCTSHQRNITEVVWHYLYFSNVPRSKQPFYDVYVFVVGGGTYTEYHNLLQWSRNGTSSTGAGAGGSNSGLGGSHGSTSSLNALGLSLSGSGNSLADLAAVGAGSSGASARRITYGGTEILTPKGFLEQVG